MCLEAVAGVRTLGCFTSSIFSPVRFYLFFLSNCFISAVWAANISPCFGNTCVILFMASLSKLNRSDIWDSAHFIVYFFSYRIQRGATLPLLSPPDSLHSRLLLHPDICLKNENVNNANPAECGGKASVLEFPSGSRALSATWDQPSWTFKGQSAACVCVWM